ncbi:hypothetical protein [Alteribacter lacisalsi]|uniref:hypothetical protein n=1 Tax=Alteribacter lacisalsi TaxID=2045244 RepID=UPI00137513E8|nr:hypothetical protein [Alteribacter lacisalsi]
MNPAFLYIFVYPAVSLGFIFGLSAIFGWSPNISTFILPVALVITGIIKLVRS